jgi:hypothetical protein
MPAPLPDSAAAQAESPEGERVDGKDVRTPVHFRVWVLLAFGSVIGGGLAIERASEGAYAQAALAGLVCLGCIAGIGWALHDRA